ncbi:NACHT domain-containing protein [Streptomyces sp. NBC_00503]|uniref:NACHT domain-containing protein n=1 Tax=Streptomyces sp. NBC_00503 TaxID=2903659 RepID=UPI002E80C919|nr:NACHT domain-containing protein [Streptomyces sp. NBC_00503]WUD85391.1 NACHT domain-containing protein [Streptomyces sp. NBC_00503]
MPAGRPRTTDRRPVPELLDLAKWFQGELETAGYASPNDLRTSRRRTGPLPGKDALYDIFGALELRTLETTQLLAQALGRSPDEVTSKWLRASRALERKKLAERRRASGAAPSWESIPLPDPWLEDLLRSQAVAAEQFPYDLLGVRKPPLSDIYVEQDFQPLPPAGSPGTARHSASVAPPSEPAPTLAGVLTSHDHLFVTGGPGAGKTTLGRHLVRQIARYWLRAEDAGLPWCPQAVTTIRVTSSDLLTPHPWSRQLSSAAARTGTLHSPVDHSHFEGRPHGARWLVVVDGLDEVSSPDVRRRLLEKLAEQARPNGPYRLVITSRPLPQEELAPFANLAGVGFYTLKGFDTAQQQAFAERWFTAQGDPDPFRQARDFLADIADASLEEVLQVPLLATIAAAFRSRNPGRPLPRGRVDLYENFLGDLRNAREGNTDALARFRERWTVRGYDGLAQWLLDHQDRLLTHLAWERTSRQPPPSLLDAALTWLSRHLPAGMEWPPGARGELGQFLAQSGVVAFDGSDLSFLHQSFAEFLAARDEAASIPADFPGFDDWSAAIANAATGNRLLFTLALWARRPGNDVTVIVRRLLAGELNHRIMALRLVTTGVPLGEVLEAAVIERLLDFSHHQDAHAYFTSSHHQVLAELAQLRGNRRLSERLFAIARTEGLPIPLRAEAAWAYARTTNLPEGVRLLRVLAEEDGTVESVLACCSHLESLDPGDSAFVVGILRGVVTDPGASYPERLTAARRLLERGSVDGLVTFARSVLSGPDLDGNLLWGAGELWYDIAGPEAAAEVAEAIAERGTINSWALVGLAQTLFRFGLPTQAVSLARRAFEETINSDDLGELISLWLELRGAQGADEIAAMMPGLHNWNDDYRAAIAFDLLRDGHPRQAAEIVRAVLEEGSGRHRSRTFKLWALAESGGTDSVAEVTSWLERFEAGPDEYADVMKRLMDAAVAPEAVLPLARKALSHPGCGDSAFTRAASVVLAHGGPGACTEVLTALDDRLYDGMPLRARLLPLFADHDEVTAVMELGTRLLSDPGVTGPELEAVVRAWLQVGGRAAVHEVVKRVEAACALTVDQSTELASLLIGLGHVSAATPLWCRVCTTRGTAVETRWQALEKLMAAGAGETAERALRTALSVEANPEEILVLKRLLAWLTAAA